MSFAKGITVGTFDGVHRGHCTVLNFLVKECCARNLKPEVITFAPHPLAVVAPSCAPKLLEMPEERKSCIEQSGVKVQLLEFNKALQSLTVEEWIRRIRDEYDAKLLVVGYDNTFGCDGRSLTFNQYVEIGERCGVEVIEAPALEGVSSSMIRRALSEGDIEAAAAMLGRNYSIEGRVVNGRRDGHKLGFPTANVHPAHEILIPKRGVYIANIIIDKDLSRRAVVNIGTAPTIQDGLPLTVEAHLLDYDGDLYDRHLRIEFLQHLRDEQHFDSLDALKAQIAADVEEARGYKDA